MLHLARRLVRKRDGENRVGRYAEADEIRDAPRDHAGFSAARARDDEQGPIGVRHGLALRIRQVFKKSLGIDHAMILREWRIKKTA